MRQITFHSFVMGDVEDPEIYAAMPLKEFMETEKGQWIQEHCSDPMYRLQPDGQSWGHRVIVYGILEDQDAVAYMLKWGKF